MSAVSTAEPAAPGHVITSSIVVGLGNPVLGDDGAGWAVADVVEEWLGGAGRADVRVERLAVGGLTLMEHLIGFRHAVVVDALLTGDDPPGTVRRLRLEDLPGRDASHIDSAHDASLADAIDAARALGAAAPETVDLVTIEAADVLELRESLGLAVAAAVPRAAALVLEILGA
jgi:hydrogenase maturation protease